MAASDFDCDVLVVGLGPVGALLATMLTDQGVSVIAIDRDTTVYPMPRAAHFDHEIMRLFQQAKVADAVYAARPAAPAYEFRSASGEPLVRMDLPSVSPSGWSTGYMFHQPAVEHALRARLAASPLADVRLGCAFDAMAPEADGVSVALTDGGVRARYVVGCDGASSAVRGAAGIGLDDYAFDEPWLVIDVKVGEAAKLPEINLQICDPARPTTCVLMGPGRHRWEFMLLPGETPEQVLDDAFIAPLLAPWNCGDVTIERKAVYRFHGLVAKQWRAGRVLLAGDSAHQTPPFAGQGMCSGMRDAANLAWKLPLVLRGEADEALLDSYQPEREPHVRAYIQLAIGMGRVVCTLDPAAAAARDAAMLAARAEGRNALPPSAPPALEAGCLLAGSPGAGTLFPQPWAGAARLDDALGEGGWLIGREPPRDLVGGLVSIALSDARLAPFRSTIEDWLADHGAEAVLVRPDRYVFGTGEARILADAWARALSPVHEPA